MRHRYHKTGRQGFVPAQRSTEWRRPTRNVRGREREVAATRARPALRLRACWQIYQPGKPQPVAVAQATPEIWIGAQGRRVQGLVREEGEWARRVPSP